MDLSGVRKEFEIYVVDSEEATRELMLESLSQRGYKVQTFASAEDALAAIESNPPHLIFSARHLAGIDGLEFLGKIKEISSDIHFILLTTYANIDSAMEAMRLGAYDYLYKPFEDIAEAAIAADHVVEKIYLQFQNEQLLEELKAKKKTVRKAKIRIRKEREDLQHVSVLLSQLRGSTDVVQTFIDHAGRVLGDMPLVFFKHLPAYFTLSVTHSSVIPMAQLRGIGLNLKNEVTADTFASLKNPKEIASFKQLLFEVFNSREFEAYAIDGDDGVGGVVVALQPIDDPGAKRLFEAMIEVLKVSFANSNLKKTLHTQSVRDSLTGLLNKKAFDQKLHEEISRARRIEMPVSLVAIGIDHFTEFTENNGQALGDIVIKMIASLLKRTSRTIDILARTGPAEFAVLLPHTGQNGAAVKAEKLRRLVEITKFPQRETQPGGRLTVSVGVSEYPSLSADAEGLVQSSDSAFFQVRTLTNKVCLAAPPPGLKPDFEAGT